MKNLIIVLFLTFLFSCTNRNNNESKTKLGVEFKNENSLDNKNCIDSLLKAVWFQKEGYFASLMLDGKYLIYPDSENEPFTYDVKGDSLIINGKPIVRCKILKITKDSLWFTSDSYSDTIKLFTDRRENE